MRVFDESKVSKRYFLKLNEYSDFTDLSLVSPTGRTVADLIRFDKNGATAMKEARGALLTSGYDADHFQFDEHGALVLK